MVPWLSQYIDFMSNEAIGYATSDRIIEIIEKGYPDTFLEKISFGNDLTNRYSLLEESVKYFV